MPKQEFVDAVIGAAKANGIPAAALLAVVEIEAEWKAFEDDGVTPCLLFERHVFYRELKERAPDKLGAAVKAGLARQKWSPSTQYKDLGPSKARLAILSRARGIDEECANRSCSWGLGQTMGFLAEELGYTSATVMLDRMVAGGVAAQVDMMIAEIKRKSLVDELQRGDWAGFARAYNGEGYKKNEYDTRLAAACRRWEAKLGGAPVGDPDLPKVQSDLIALGYDLGPAGADGVLGRRTREAVLRFQEEQGLAVDGKIGPQTKAAILAAIQAKESPRSAALAKPPVASPPPAPVPVPAPANAPSTPEPVQPTKEVIEFVQRRLRELNYSHVGNVDGELGGWTEDAILAFRRGNSLPLVPIIDSQLLVALAGAKPKVIAETRANATPAQVARKIPAVAAARAAVMWSKVQAFGALIVAAITGMLQWTGEAVDKLSPLQATFGSAPMWLLIAAVAGVSFLLWRNSRAATADTVDAYRSARLM
ncbi:N-acetylmuramidase domain-containing protein [Xanthobacter sp. 126]|uniref:N-acetylmuramidase domain-containing protein n=1 Tax=Xanthobacter sp. 126 TaxID=1131814 RepID=UPI0004BBC2CF|nr:N-acetylmuramidase domain-containing protein [Xanthobacter sp. 126]